MFKWMEEIITDGCILSSANIYFITNSNTTLQHALIQMQMILAT